ncbi:MAG: hypothetical protein CENE_02456 [Candidatus Celerinatantimonas neptuna]|nr:MAG: hypothetical protein CENE_02456 [Candidatus Celerinatantimonas neptuna]
MSLELNCCKSWRCENFGLPHSEHYQPLSHHLGYPALHCKLCGSFPPLIDSQIIEKLIHEKLPTQLPRTPIDCPNCLPSFKRFTHPPQRYGTTSAGHQRLRCRNCGKVYTPAQPPKINVLLSFYNVLHQQSRATDAIKQLKISSKLYYQLLRWCALLLGQYTRKLEYQYLPKQFLALQSESTVLELAGGLRLWLLSSAEATSGYQLMESHNLAQLSLNQAYYTEQGDNRLNSYPEFPLTQALKKRYQQLLTRYHFEDLQYGPSNQWNRYHLVKPRLIAYAHFQMLQSLIAPQVHQHHYLEQESCIRGAAIMGAIQQIRKQQADIFYLFAHPDQQTAFLADGRPVGWWKDRWFNTTFGGYCPITERRSYRFPFQMNNIASNQIYFQEMKKKIPGYLKSLAPLNAWLTLQRCQYNFLIQNNTEAPASKLGMPIYQTPESFLKAAYDDYRSSLQKSSR